MIRCQQWRTPTKEKIECLKGQRSDDKGHRRYRDETTTSCSRRNKSSYTISKLTGIGENVETWLDHFKRHATLQQLTVNQYFDAVAFHITAVAETWIFTLPKSTKTNWVKLLEVCRQRFAVSQHGRWRHERDLYLLRQQPGQGVANYTADILKASRGFDMSQAQLLSLVLEGLHPTVVPFVEQSQPESVDELLQCSAARNGMKAPID